MNNIFDIKIDKHLPRNTKKSTIDGLKKMGIETMENLLYNFPVRYVDVYEFTDAGEALKGMVNMKGTIGSIKMRKTYGKRRVMIAEAFINDGERSVKVVWFNQPYIAKKFKVGDYVKIAGSISKGKNTYITNPEISLIEKKIDEKDLFKNINKKKSGELKPIYRETKGVSSFWMETFIKKMLKEDFIQNDKDIIPEKILEKLKLPKRRDAFYCIHNPKEEKFFIAAKKRFLFEAVFLMHLSNYKNKDKRQKQLSYEIALDENKVKEFVKKFEFEMTSSQLKSIDTILKDVSQNIPMARLLQGDVGSGKTAVALSIIYGIAFAKPFEKTSGKPQVAYLAPIEILAKQQFENMIKYFSGTGVKIGLLTSKDCYKYPSKIDPQKATKISKAQLRKWIDSGEIAIIVGTHALIQKSISFKRLSLLVIDEQQRFGVAQRNAILENSNEYTPHLLSMSATPIPRTLALTIYGDLDISVMDDMPKGRKEVKTTLLKNKDVLKAYEHIREEVLKGKQCYIICPKIEVGDGDLRSVEEEYKYLSQNIFKDLSIDKLHGKMKPNEKVEIMEKFKNKETSILVSTTIIEVGVNVENATTIMILHAERFGLSQLHQIRGRVLRSNDQAYCFVVSDSTNELTYKRLKNFTSTTNGFRLAELDLKERGGGELGGLKQSGLPDFTMEGLQNEKLVELSQNMAKDLLKDDIELDKYKELKEALKNKINYKE